MGYRHQVISDTMAPKKEKLPEWFVNKYDGNIDFDRQYWASFTELKRYMALDTFNEDVQKILKELDDGDSIKLIYFADESDERSPDVIHAYITADEIVEITPTGWGEI